MATTPVSSPPSRRVLLCSLGSVVLAGCLSGDEGTQGHREEGGEDGEGGDNDEGEEDGQGEENGDDGDTRDEYPTFDVTGDELNEEQTSLRPDVTVTRQPSESNPGQIDVTVSNVGASPVTLAGGAPRPFSGLHSGRESGREPAVVLFPSDTEYVSADHVGDEYDHTEDRTEPVDGCWLVEAVHVDSVRVQRTIEAGDELGETYSVYGRPGAEECMSAGSHRFVDPRWEVEPRDGDEYTLEWGFTLEVEY